MPIRHIIWRAGWKPEALKQGKLETEATLEEMIVAAPIVIELKRAKTPREVVAQALDYAGWAESLEAEHLGRSSNRPVIGPIVSIRGAGSAFFARSLAEIDDYTADMMFCGCYDRDYGILNCSAVRFL